MVIMDVTRNLLKLRRPRNPIRKLSVSVKDEIIMD